MASSFLPSFGGAGESSIVSFCKQALGFSEKVKAAIEKDPEFDSDEFIKKLPKKEADFWLRVVIKDICSDPKLDLDYDEKFKRIIDNTDLTTDVKIEKISNVFESAIQNKDQKTKDKIIEKLRLTSNEFYKRSNKELWKQRAMIAASIICTVAAVFLVANVVSAIMSMTFRLAMLGVAGLGVSYAAPQAAKAVADSGVVGAGLHVASKGASAVGTAVTKSGIIEKLSAAALACVACVTLNPFTLKKEYQNLTGAVLGAERLVKLADDLGKEHGVSHKKTPTKKSPKQ